MYHRKGTIQSLEQVLDAISKLTSTMCVYLPNDNHLLQVSYLVKSDGALAENEI